MLVAEVMCHLAGHPHFSRLVYLEAIAEGPYLSTLARKWFRPLMERIIGELEASPEPLDLEEGMLPLVATLFLHATFGHFALAPLLHETLDADPLSEEGVERQTRFIDTLILKMFPLLASHGEAATQEDVDD
jgi:hypothetical protein